VPAHIPDRCFSCYLPQKAREDESTMTAVAVRVNIGDALCEAAPSTEGVQVCAARHVRWNRTQKTEAVATPKMSPKSNRSVNKRNIARML